MEESWCVHMKALSQLSFGRYTRQGFWSMEEWFCVCNPIPFQFFSCKRHLPTQPLRHSIPQASYAHMTTVPLLLSCKCALRCSCDKLKPLHDCTIEFLLQVPCKDEFRSSYYIFLHSGVHKISVSHIAFHISELLDQHGTAFYCCVHMWESICLPLLGNDTVKENDRAFDMNDLAYTSFDTILYIEPRSTERHK